MWRWRAGLGAAGVLAVLAGCGSRTPSPQVISPGAPGGFQSTLYPAAGLRLATPRNWTTASVHPPQVALVSSGLAVISLWRYPETRPGPRTPAQLRRAEQRLIASVRSRSRSLRVLASSTASVAGYPAVELQTDQTVGGAKRRVQSTHLYEPGEEVVLEEYAPLSLFGSLERSVFSVVQRSLTPLSR